MKYFFLSIFLFCCTASIAQSSLIDRLHTMQKNPRLKEKVYVHTNKTSYFPDDVIWFKAYVGDSINYPSVQTRKLNVNLIDLEGNVIFSRNILIEDGVGSGQLELNEAIGSGTYYLQARTNYMRNFGEDYQYLQEIKILGQELIENSEKDDKYDVQLLPEGGHLIESIENVLGIKATKNGQSIDFTGGIFNQQEELVAKFKSEHAGLSSCKFIYEKGEKYNARIRLQDTTLVLTLPPVLAQGIALQVDNTDENNLKIHLKTNEATFFNQVYSNYSLLYYQDRQIFNLISVARLDSLTALIETNKKIFLEGVHTVTLFADNKPIAERKFFIETDRKKSFITLEKSKIENDSIAYRLLAKGKRKNPEIKLSVSVLQKKNGTIDVKNTIESDFLLTPYVKGYVENPAYYFNTENDKRKEHLDLLLLTQGWTGYTLTEIIRRINPEENYKFETGFELKGTLKDEARHKNIVLIPNNFRIIDKVSLNGQSDFTFQNLNVFKYDTVRVAYQNWLGKIIKPMKIVYDTIESKSVPKFLIPNTNKLPKTEINTADTSNKILPDEVNLVNTNLQPRNFDGTIILDEAIVSEKKRSERYLERRKVIEKYKPLVRDIGKYRDIPIPEVLIKYNHNLMAFLTHQGFRLQTYDSFRNYLQGTKSIGLLFINGRFIQPEELPSSVQLQMKDIANIMVHNTSVLRPRRRVNLSYFHVFTSEKTTELFDKFVITDGFDHPKKYYTPLYAFERPKPINIREIDWKPHLTTNKKGEVYFKIARNHKIDSLFFVIQGFSNQGHLISKTIRAE